jgi:microcin C transport system permease protein
VAEAPAEVNEAGPALSPITRRRLENFRANKRGFWSLWIFLVLFILSLFAELIANDKPLLVGFDGAVLSPVVFAYPETYFGGEFETEADYRDPFVAQVRAHRPEVTKGRYDDGGRDLVGINRGPRRL